MVVVYGCSVLCNSVVRVWVHVCVCVVRVHLGTRVGHLVVGTCVWGGGYMCAWQSGGDSPEASLSALLPH